MKVTAAPAGADGQTVRSEQPERVSPAGRPGTRLIDGCWAGAVLIAVAGAVLTAAAWSDFKANDAISNMGGAISAVAYATLGALIVRRARNPIGWLLLIEGVSRGMMTLFSGYAVVGILTHPGALPAAKPVGAVAEWAFFPVVAALAYMLLLFPTRDTAIAALASGRGAQFPGHRAAVGWLDPGAQGGGPPGARRLHPHLPEPV